MSCAKQLHSAPRFCRAPTRESLGKQRGEAFREWSGQAKERNCSAVSATTKRATYIPCFRGKPPVFHHSLAYLRSFPNQYLYKGVVYHTIDLIFVCSTIENAPIIAADFNSPFVQNVVLRTCNLMGTRRQTVSNVVFNIGLMPQV